MMSDIFAEIKAERARQDAKWGGPEHDDNHMMWDWHALIVNRADRSAQSDQDGDLPGYRHRLVQVAALAVAAIEAFDRGASR